MERSKDIVGSVANGDTPNECAGKTRRAERPEAKELRSRRSSSSRHSMKPQARLAVTMRAAGAKACMHY
eukprot:859375-Amphidinium_carterae.2